MDFNKDDKVKIKDKGTISTFFSDKCNLYRIIERQIGIPTLMEDGTYSDLNLIITRKFNDGERYDNGDKMWKYKLKIEETGEEIDYVWTKEFLEERITHFWLVNEIEEFKIINPVSVDCGQDVVSPPMWGTIQPSFRPITNAPSFCDLFGSFSLDEFPF
ncbi:MAG: hypothetical protein ACRCX2_01245 [Paraclostridium sp.]